MRAWPIRVRITLGFAVAMAVVLTVVGLLGYRQLSTGLADDLDRELQQRAQDLTPAVNRPGAALADPTGTGFIEQGESFAEIVATDGRVLQSTPTLAGRPLLSSAEITEAGGRTIFVDRPTAPGLDEPARLLATRVTRAGNPAYLVVGLTRGNGEETLARVRLQLVVGLPLLLLLTSLLGYLLTGAALRPVEVMRRRASTMSGAELGPRLPLPPGNDELARLGTTLNDLLDRVGVTVARERAFVATASHELRTPLALLRTELELALRRPRSVPDLTGAIGSALEEVDRLTQLAEDLLLLAGADEGAPGLSPEPLEVAVLLDAVATRFRPVARARGRHITVDAGGAGPVEVDAGRLERALLNLVGNAFQHGAGEIALSARTSGEEVELRVTDEGDGFSPPMLAHALERFAHSPSSGGSGLGLSIVAAVAQAHGGRAGVANRPGSGALAWIRLPARQECRQPRTKNRD